VGKAKHAHAVTRFLFRARGLAPIAENVRVGTLRFAHPTALRMGKRIG
jgi:hypothetical protein